MNSSDSSELFVRADGAGTPTEDSRAKTHHTVDRDDWQVNEPNSEPPEKRRRGRPKGSKDKRPRRRLLSRMSTPLGRVPWQPGPTLSQQQQSIASSSNSIAMASSGNPNSFSTLWQSSNGPPTDQNGALLAKPMLPSGTNADMFQKPCSVSPRTQAPIWSPNPAQGSIRRPPPLATAALFSSSFSDKGANLKSQVWKSHAMAPMPDHAPREQKFVSSGRKETHESFFSVAAALSPSSTSAASTVVESAVHYDATESVWNPDWNSASHQSGQQSGDESCKKVQGDWVNLSTYSPAVRVNMGLANCFRHQQKRPQPRGAGSLHKYLPFLQDTGTKPSHARKQYYPQDLFVQAGSVESLHEQRDEPALMHYSTSAHQLDELALMHSNYPQPINPNLVQLSLDRTNSGDGSGLFTDSWCEVHAPNSFKTAPDDDIW
eukprot:CAMPEP_0114554438 /NCGR_PEP_ID=MMETSP0114-20121206/8212_1 /TAXON_ID=31324 /ORGANISM="Goniomonas sp, Strain m" /LENGTH=431 /DNA_ID=CAMNT_0001739489 /DNA_START=26 /DNA_END=1318 /DNA_ORIENTATION=-